MSRTAFLKMYQAYKDSFGHAYPKRDPAAVFKVLDACSGPSPTTQVEIAKATGLEPGEVSKIVSKAREQEWIPRRDGPKTGNEAEMISLTARGRDVLAAFEQRCVQVCENLVGTKATPSTQSLKDCDGDVLSDDFDNRWFGSQPK